MATDFVFTIDYRCAVDGNVFRWMDHRCTTVGHVCKLTISSCFIKRLSFSSHISYGKGKDLTQTVFFYKTCQAQNLYLKLRLLPIKFNSHKFTFVRCVFVENSGISKLTQGPQNDPKRPKNDPKKRKFPIFYVLMQFLSIFR